MPTAACQSPCQPIGCGQVALEAAWPGGTPPPPAVWPRAPSMPEDCRSRQVPVWEAALVKRMKRAIVNRLTAGKTITLRVVRSVGSIQMTWKSVSHVKGRAPAWNAHNLDALPLMLSETYGGFHTLGSSPRVLSKTCQTPKSQYMGVSPIKNFFSPSSLLRVHWRGRSYTRPPIR